MHISSGKFDLIAFLNSIKSLFFIASFSFIFEISSKLFVINSHIESFPFSSILNCLSNCLHEIFHFLNKAIGSIVI
ncbi:MAG: hypothetical protein Q8S84_02125 [bacterium]|nr:hypothetical protein [bacterium]